MLISAEQWVTQKNKVDIILFDERGAKWLSRCIPNNATTVILPRRVLVKRLFNLSLLSTFLYWFIFGDFGKSGVRARLISSYFVAFIKKVNPKVVLSNNDGSEVIRAIHINCTGIFVAAIQLATRERFQNSKILTLPVYYSFGQAEGKLFLASGLNCDDLRPVGSLRNSIYLDEIRRESGNVEDGPEIVFISQWKRGLMLNPQSRIYKLINIGHRKTFQAVQKYATAHSMSLGIVLRNTRDQDDDMLQQEKYFVEAAGTVDLMFLRGLDDLLDSYKHAYSAKLVVNFLSTLGYEVFGAGKRVLFSVGLGGGEMFISEWGVRELVEELPSHVVLLDDHEDQIPRMISQLREMSNEEYESSTQKAREYYMGYNQQERTHINIRSDIQAILST